jgi:Short C-terminal domain
MSAETSNTAETISAIKRARAAGDLAEVERLKAPSHRLLANAGESRDQSPPAADRLERLATLADLHDRGALTDSEFAAEKAKILGRD